MVDAAQVEIGHEYSFCLEVCDEVYYKKRIAQWHETAAGPFYDQWPGGFGQLEIIDAESDAIDGCGGVGRCGCVQQKSLRVCDGTGTERGDRVGIARQSGLNGFPIIGTECLTEYGGDEG